MADIHDDLDRIPIESVKLNMSVMSADKPGKVIGWKCDETIGIGIANPKVTRIGIAERITIRTWLWDSGWELIADVFDGRAEVSLRTACSSDSQRVPLKRIFTGEGGRLWESDYGGRENLLNRHVRPVYFCDDANGLAVHVLERVSQVMDPMHGDMLPSERNGLHLNRIPSSEWEGWKSFLKDMFDAIEVSSVHES